MLKRLKKKNNLFENGLSDFLVFLDFDNTITTFDVLDDIIARFSINERWKELENDWIAGKIGSKECLEGQLQEIRITKNDLSRYLRNKVKIDRHFKRLLTFLRKNKIKPVIVSDDFYWIINSILRNNGIKAIKIFCNNLKFKKDRLITSFPHVNKLCLKSANCKKMHLLNNCYGKKKIIFIGDGISDICPAVHADLAFAKGSLLKYLKANKKPHVAYADLGDVYKYLKGATNGRKA
ncbi:MAG: MtnX-like HAD-IB family phosphatase [Candidatus Omnitrophica bacterium]|nr:MtnX-like HAD-IB family phosphatase [Candidatus Omnitrophota bacterium]